jgi:hypothetical protein
MSTILRGYTSVQNQSKIFSNELKLDIRAAKDGRVIFIVDISDKDFKDFDTQVEDTIEYLTKNKAALLALKNNIGQLSWNIDFGYAPKIVSGELAVEGLFFPLQLVENCSELGIELLISLYDSRLFQE